MAARGLCDFAHHIALARSPRAVADGVIGGRGGPQAEAIVMLAGEDDAAHATIGKGADNGVGIEGGGIEDVGILIAVAPFLVGERVDGEVEEGGEFERVPRELTGAGHGAIGGRGSRSGLRDGGGSGCEEQATGDH